MAKVLLVEDDVNLADSYSILLSKEGHEIELARDGEEAVTKAIKYQPDIILLDLLMPRATGLDFLKEYNQRVPDNTAKVIVMTNLNMIQAELEAMKLGANRYMVKSSMSPHELAEVIRSELG